MTGNEKMALGSLVGLGTLIALAFAFSKVASAAGSAPATTASGNAPNQTAASTPTGLQASSARGQAAIALANALNSAGQYCLSQSPLVTAYQSQLGITADGYPGAVTMNALVADIGAMQGQTGVPSAPTLTIYPWTAGQGWGNSNAPALAQYNGC
jgi:hypothetical protein